MFSIRKFDFLKSINPSMHAFNKEFNNRFLNNFNSSFMKISFQTFSVDNLYEKKNFNLLMQKEQQAKENHKNDSHSSDSEMRLKDEQEYREYNKILELIKKVKLSFDFQTFYKIMSYIQDNDIYDFFIFKEFENIVISNIDLIDKLTLSNAIKLLGDSVSMKKLSLEEQNWFIFFKSFISIIDTLTFEEYYNFIVSFDKIKNFFSDKKIIREFEKFIGHDNIHLLNNGKITIQNLDDITLVIVLY